MIENSANIILDPFNNICGQVLDYYVPFFGSKLQKILYAMISRKDSFGKEVIQKILWGVLETILIFNNILIESFHRNKFDLQRFSNFY